MRPIFLSIAFFLVTAPALSKEKGIEPSGLELQQIQSRQYEVSIEVLFPSVITVLQDSGYIIQAADRGTGLITAVGSARSKTTYNIFWGFGKKKRSPFVSAFVESRSAGSSRVRLNFVLSETKSRGYGISSSDDEMVTDPAVYQDAFEKIDKEIFVRVATDAPSARLPASPSSTVVDAGRTSAATTDEVTAPSEPN
jgi:hypothetical protein